MSGEDNIQLKNHLDEENNFFDFYHFKFGFRRFCSPNLEKKRHSDRLSKNWKNSILRLTFITYSFLKDLNSLFYSWCIKQLLCEIHLRLMWPGPALAVFNYLCGLPPFSNNRYLYLKIK